MRLNYPLILSIIIHLLLIFSLILQLPEVEEPVEESVIEIELVTKKEEKSVKKGSNNINHVDIKDIDTEVDVSTSNPERDRYLMNESNFDLVLQETTIQSDTTDVQHSFDVEDFEMVLMDFSPVEEIIEEVVEDNSPEFRWEGDSREVVYNSYIDFSSFPETSFTGVGATVSFSVNENGEVFNVEVLPPGSGSTDFDILIKQYVSRFRFNKRDEVSRGELVVKYKK